MRNYSILHLIYRIMVVLERWNLVILSKRRWTEEISFGLLLETKQSISRSITELLRRVLTLERLCVLIIGIVFLHLSIRIIATLMNLHIRLFNVIIFPHLDIRVIIWKVKSISWILCMIFWVKNVIERLIYTISLVLDKLVILCWEWDSGFLLAILM